MPDSLSIDPIDVVFDFGVGVVDIEEVFKGGDRIDEFEREGIFRMINLIPDVKQILFWNVPSLMNGLNHVILN